MIERRYSSDVAFTPAVKAIQTARGSRGAYHKMEERGGWKTTITPELAAFVAAQTSIFLATVNAEGQPYIQHRGGPAGFLRALDDHTLGFADYRGNRQYISLGNLSENPKAFLFLIDYAHQRRIKLWGEARVITDDADLLQRLMPEAYQAVPEQALVFKITAWDANCPQHIPQRFDADDVAMAIAARDHKIAALEAELARLKPALA